MYSTYYGSRQDGYGYNADMLRFGFDHLDIVSSMLGWWSFSRRVLRRYTGPLFRARRSTDSVERDWYPYGPFGEVPIAAFQEWCSGGDAFAVTLYDQSGLARNFAQATTAIQPILAESGTAITENGRLAAKFVAADARRMSIASSTAMFNALHTTGGTVLAVSRANDTAGSKTLVASLGSLSTVGFWLYSDASENTTVSTTNTGTVLTVNGTFSPSASASNLISAIVVDPDASLAADRLFGWFNGASVADNNSSTIAPITADAHGDFMLGSRVGGSAAFDGTISELALFSALISTADRTAWQSRSGNFYGVTIS